MCEIVHLSPCLVNHSRLVGTHCIFHFKALCRMREERGKKLCKNCGYQFSTPVPKQCKHPKKKNKCSGIEIFLKALKKPSSLRQGHEAGSGPLATCSLPLARGTSNPRKSRSKTPPMRWENACRRTLGHIGGNSGPRGATPNRQCVRWRSVGHSVRCARMTAHKKYWDFFGCDSGIFLNMNPYGGKRAAVRGQHTSCGWSCRTDR